jgi:hypothetical protein
LSFYLDAFLFFALGTAIFLVTDSIRRKLWPQWSSHATTIAGGLLTLVFELMSIYLYLDDDGSSPVYKFLKLFLPIADPSGGYIMLHTNATGVTKADMPWSVVILLYALYPVWVYLGYKTARNLSVSASISRSRARATNLGRIAWLFGFPIGGCLLLFGLAKFPGGILRESNLAAFYLTVIGIALTLVSVMGLTTPLKNKTHATP